MATGWRETPDFLKEEKLVQSWWFLTSPVHVATILTAYFILVKLVGPRMMENRKPYKLKWFMICTNFGQVVANVWIIHHFMIKTNGIKYVWENSCYPIHLSKDSYRINIVEGYYIFYIMKLADLMDTFIFTLRKKFNQVSVLHLFHHIIMVLNLWVCLIYFRESFGLSFAFYNTVIHIIMHSYYLLSAFGPTVRKYLWWKKYITSLQIMQFVVMLSTLFYTALRGCDIDPKFTIIWACTLVAFLFLFIDFYRHQYFGKKKKLRDTLNCESS